MPLLPNLSRAGRVPARVLRTGLIALSALSLITCTDNPIAPGRTGRLLVRPVFDGSALFAPLAVDNLRLTVVRPPNEILKSITQPFPANANTVTVTAADIPLESTTEDLLVTIELYAGPTLLFSGTQTVTVTAGVTPQAAPIPMLYQGPGANLTTLALAPRDTTVRPGGVFSYQVTAADAQQQPVTSFYVGWQASAGAITGTGQFTAPATRDTITITVSAPAPNTTRDSTRVFVIPAPGSLAISGGDAQAALVGTRLPQLLAVRVNGTDNLPLPGVVVNFAATTGGGSVDSATATSDAQGVARTGATLGSAVGQQTFTASSAGLTSVIFTATASAPVGGRTWTGATSTDWSVAGNWNPQLVPTSADDVVIPPASNQPTVTTSCAAKSIVVNSGATLNLGTFNCQVQGNVFSDGGIIGTGAVQIQAAGQVRGNFPSLLVSAPVTAGSATGISGNLTVTGAGATFGLNGQTVSVAGNFATQGGALLVMTNAGDVLHIGGNASFTGGDETGQLTAGTVTVLGNFTQSGSGSPTSFVGSGTHTVFLSGTGAQTINFGTPGFAASRFQNVIIDNAAGGVTATSDLYATGTPGATPTAVRTLSGNGSTLFTTILDVSNFTLNNLLVNFAGSALVGFDTVTFQGYAPTATPLTISHPGAGGPFTFTDVTFTVTPTTGFYISATDANPGDGVPLVINMVNPTPTSPGGRVQTAGGAVVNWAPPVGGRTWTGATSTDWSVASNWTPQAVPTSADDVLIPSGPTRMPVVTTSCSAKSLTVNAGATLDLGTFNCQVLGNVLADGAVTGTGALQLSAAAQIRGIVPSLIVNNVSIAVGAPLTVNGNVTITGASASFDVGGTLVQVSGSFTTQSGGLLQMNNAAGSLVVQGNFLAGGGNELGLMAAGTLSIGGNLTQVGTAGADPNSFHPSNTHVTVFTGASPTITFGTPGDVPGSSHFQGFSWTGTGTLTLASDVYSHGEFSTSSTTPITVSSTASRLLQIGSHTGAGPITFNNVRLSLQEETIGSALALSNATFTGLPSTATQLTVSHSGVGGPFTFANLSFSPVPTTGFYISATDLDGTANAALTIYMVSPNPSSPSTFVQQVNGAQVLWPATGNIFTWIGAANSDWFNPANWDRNAVPGFIDDVVLNPITNQPSLTNNAGVNNVTSTTGSVLDLNGFVLVAGGDVDLAGSIVDVVGNGGVTLTGSGKLVRGTINTEVVVTGSYLMNGNLVTNANLSVQGSLDLGAFTAQVGGSFVTLNTGVLVMKDPGALLDVTGDAIFTGGSTDGLLTAGTLRIAGAFDQVNVNSPQSFAASPGHLTELVTDPASITFTSPGPTTSHFGDLAESGFGATFTLNSDVTVLGFLSGGDGFGGTLVGATCPVVFTVTTFSTSGPLNLDCVQLVVDDPAGTNTFGINGVTFSNMPTDVTQLTIRHPGLAAGPLTTGTLTFVPLVTGNTGHYIDAVDTDGSTPFLIVSPFTTPGVTNGQSFTTTSGGASVVWP